MGRGSGIKTLVLRISKADCFVGLRSEEEVGNIQTRGGNDWTRSGKFVLPSQFNINALGCSKLLQR